MAGQGVLGGARLLDPPDAADAPARDRPERRGTGLGDAVIVELRPFDAAVIDRLVRERLGLRLALPMLRRVTDVAGGNPLYALELCRALADAGLDAADAAAALPVPGSLSELLHARLQQLPQRVRRALLAAALAGTPTVELVQAAEAVEADDLDRAVDIGVLEPGFERVRFAHPLYAEALRGGASADERKAVHNRLARLVNDPEERAVHIARGASGPDEQVAQTLVWGAARARGRGAPSAAAELLELAVDLTPRGVGALHARRLDAASAHLAAGDTARADSMLRAAVEAAGPDRNRAEALWRLAWLRSRSSFEEAAKLNLEALRYSEEDLGLLARIHKSLAFDLHQTDADGGERHAEAAVAIAETLPDPQLLAEALAALGRVRHWCRGQIDHALFRRAIALEAAAPDLAVGDRPRLIYAIALLDTDELALAVQLLHELLEDCRRQGEADVTSPIFFLAMAELERGRLSAAWDYASEAALVADQTGLTTTERSRSRLKPSCCSGGSRPPMHRLRRCSRPLRTMGRPGGASTRAAYWRSSASTRATTKQRSHSWSIRSGPVIPRGSGSCRRLRRPGGSTRRPPCSTGLRHRHARPALASRSGWRWGELSLRWRPVTPRPP